MSFIKLTGPSGDQFAINTDNVVSFSKITKETRKINAEREVYVPEGAVCLIRAIGETFLCTETFDQVMRKIEKVGQTS